MFLSLCLWPFHLRVSVAGYAVLGSHFLSLSTFDRSFHCSAVGGGVVESDANLMTFPWSRAWCFCLDAQTHFPLPLKSGHFNRLTLKIEHSGSIFPGMRCVLSRRFSSLLLILLLFWFSLPSYIYIYLLRFSFPVFYIYGFCMNPFLFSLILFFLLLDFP